MLFPAVECAAPSPMMTSSEASQAERCGFSAGLRLTSREEMINTNSVGSGISIITCFDIHISVGVWFDIDVVFWFWLHIYIVFRV
jgi:hypothetical protein